MARSWVVGDVTFDLVSIQISAIVLIHLFPIIINIGQSPLGTCNGMHNDVQSNGQGYSSRIFSLP
jgi:hypothetical protein